MDMIKLMEGVLEADARDISDNTEPETGQSVALSIGRALARASIGGDIKAAAMLMELAGTDFRSRDSVEKHEIDRQKLNLGRTEIPRVVIEDVRPLPVESGDEDP